MAGTWRWLQAAEDFYSDTGGLRLTKSKAEKIGGQPRADEVFSRPSLSNSLS